MATTSQSCIMHVCQRKIAFHVTLLGRQRKIMTTFEIELDLDLSVRLLNQSLVIERIKTHCIESYKNLGKDEINNANVCSQKHNLVKLSYS